MGQYSQQKRHALRLWTKTNETEKGWRTGEHKGKFNGISLEGWTRSFHANMDPQPAEGNFCDDSNHPVKSHIMEQYNWHMGNVDSSYRMANSYVMSWSTFKWTTKLFFHLLGLTVLNSQILSSSCGAKYTHRDFRLLLVRNLIEEAAKSQDHPTPRLVGRASVGAKNVLRLESRHNKHWPAKSSAQLRCHLCSSHGQRKGTV